MSRRTYNQHCGLAVALDVVGERWALLIVRDLAPGPRRFTDLQAGLPGLATDLLADRLRSLQAADAVQIVEVSYPSPARLYQLTRRGEELYAIARQLADWGMALLPNPRSGFRINPRWALQSMAHSYRGGLPAGDYAFALDGEELFVTINAHDSGSLHYGTTAMPRFHLTLTANQFFRIATSITVPTRLVVHGDASLVLLFFRAMELPRGHDRDHQVRLNPTPTEIKTQTVKSRAKRAANSSERKEIKTPC